MGLKDLFSKEGRKERALQKNCAKAANNKIKPDDRKPALYALLEDDSDEALAGLLKRFTFNYDTNIVSDEEEKDLVFNGLLQKGARIRAQLEAHLDSTPTLSWGLRLLHEVFDAETTWQVVSKVLERFEPGYERDPSRKIQLITFLCELDDPRVAQVITPYLKDHDETVRYMTVEGLFKRAQAAAQVGASSAAAGALEDVAREVLLQAMCDEEEESLRLKNRIAEGFVETGWLVKGYRGTVEKVLSADYLVDSKGKVRKKKQSAASASE